MLSPEILLRLRQVWQQDSKPHNAKMLWAASYLCIFSFLQSSEIVSPSENEFDPLTYLCFCDVRVDSHSSPSCLQIMMCNGVSGRRLCPVLEVLNYMVARGSSPGPLFTWKNGHYVTRESFVARVRLALSAAGYIAKNYAGHSFRIGAATMAAQCGIQDSKPLAGGRAAYTHYIKTALEVLCKVSKAMLPNLEPKPQNQ